MRTDQPFYALWQDDDADWWVVRDDARVSGPHSSRNGAAVVMAGMQEADAATQAKVLLGYPTQAGGG